MRLTANKKMTALCAALLGTFAYTATAQQRNLRPVTDAMLQNPEAGRLAVVAAHAESLGVQPPERRSTSATSRSFVSSGRGRSRKACRKARRSFTTA